MKTKIISFGIHKGGVGKTTSTVNVGSILAKKGYRVLLIDMDSQANLTKSLIAGTPENDNYLAMTGKEDELPITNIGDNLDIVPSSLALAKAEIELTSVFSRETMLKRLIEPIKSNYDFILIDCPTSLGLLTQNAFTASNEIIVPIIAEPLPYEGLENIFPFTDKIRTYLNPDAHITGILITRWEPTRITKDFREGIINKYKELVFNTHIRKNITLADAPLTHQNIVDFSPKSNGAADYIAFTDELLQRLHITK